MATPSVSENSQQFLTDRTVTDQFVAESATSLGEVSEVPPLWVRPAKIGALLAAGTVAIAAINPTDSGFAVCWSQRLGIDCPFCGGLRTVTSLVHGDFMAALDHNVILAVALPLLAVAWTYWMITALMNRPVALPKFPRWLIASAGFVLLAFTVARNVGGPEWVQYLASSTYG
ncbi:MAG TPA: DUF2752 domain-containing protein [Microthrixaceae bacterium]|nr:DUF2752 domain-containing protein [Microthrixaceae bacterium]